MSLKRALSPGPGPGSTTSPSNASSSEIHTSQAIHDRGSKFIALFSISPKYLSNPALLQKHTSLEGSMHRVLAWRKLSNQTSLDPSRRVYSTFSDEDGETYAGKHVEKVLSQADVEGVCVVGRWFGGTLLGPVRFEHIENVAREAIELWQGSAMDGREGKKMKVEADESRKGELVDVLNERDESIRVLRGLLAEKQQTLGGLKGDVKESPAKTTPAPTASPAKAVSYDVMSVAQLRGQEKARDATLTWILKQIEGVEKEIEEIADLPEVEDGGGDADPTEAKADGRVENNGEDKAEITSKVDKKTESVPEPDPKAKNE